MSRRRNDSNELDLYNYNSYEDGYTKKKKKIRPGCVVLIILALIAGIVLVGILRKNAIRASNSDGNPQETTPINVAPVTDILISSGVSRALYDSSGRRISLTDLNGREAADDGSIVPVRLSSSLSSDSLQAVNQIAYPEGAVIDPQSGQLVVFGKPATSGPSTSSSDFIVALRSVYDEQFPGVSIDPTQSKTLQDVRYIGQTEGTHAGQLMFEADRLMKNLSLGQDNITRQTITSNVSGFQTMFDYEFSLGDQTEGEQKRRFWFVIPKVTIEQNPAGDGMLITHLELAVKTEYLDANWNTLAIQPPDPAGQAFAAQLTTHYDEYAREFPVLEELRTMAYWTALAQWVKQADLPIQAGLWLRQVPQSVETPTTTPAITVSQQKTQADIIRTITLWGGVDLTVNLGVEDASPATRSIFDKILSRLSKPGGAPEADVVAGIATNQADQGFASSIQLPLGNLRFNYQSAKTTAVSPVESWSLALPRMEAVITETNPEPLAYIYTNPDQVTPDTLLYGGTSTKTGNPVYVDIKDGLHLEVKPDSLYLLQGTFTNGSDFEYSPDQYTNFDLDGEILTEARSQNDTTQYTRQDGLLVGIESPQEKLELQYDQAGKLQVIKGNNGQYQLTYSGELLTEIRDPQGQKLESFEYKDKKLVKIMDALGEITHEVRYDSSNRVSAVWLKGNNAPSVLFYDWQDAATPYVYTGAALLPWWQATDQNLEDLKTVLRIKKKSPIIDQILFVREVKDRLLVLFTDQTYSLPKSISNDPRKLRASLSGISKQAAGSKYVLISSGETAGTGFLSLFLDAVPLSADGLNEAQILGNLASLENPHGMTPENSDIINGLPRPDQLEATKIKVNDPSVWSEKFEMLDGTIKAAGFIPLPGKATSFQIALAKSSTFIVLEAHSDGTKIYLPDGSEFSLDLLTDADRAKLRELKPIVFVLSCYTGKVVPTENFSFAKKLLDTGASLVVAPTGVLPVDKAHDLVKGLLNNPAKDTNVVRAFYNTYFKVFQNGLIRQSSGAGNDDIFIKSLIGELYPTYLEAL